MKHIFKTLVFVSLLFPSLSAQPPKIILETEHLYFRPFVESDLEQLFKMYSDKEVMKYIPMEKALGKKIDKVTIKEMLDFFIEHQKKHGYSHWAAFEKGSNEFVGRIGLVKSDKDDQKESNKDVAEAGYIMHKKFWGKGYATESMRKIINWTFSNTNVTKIISIADPKHVASKRVMEKVGMHFEKEGVWFGITFVVYKINRPTPLSWIKQF